MIVQVEEAVRVVTLFGEDFGWHEVPSSQGGWVYFKGYLAGCAGPTAAISHIQQIIGRTEADSLIQGLMYLDGHLALVADLPAQCIVAVDRVRSIPLLLARDAS